MTRADRRTKHAPLRPNVAPFYLLTRYPGAWQSVHLSQEETAAMNKTTALSADEWKALAGSEVGVSDWFAVGQPLIDDFAEVTGDKQFIHVDPARAKAESPYGGTVAHGFLTLSLLPVMARNALPDFKDARARINYGFDKIRFLAPVPASARIRARFRLLQADERRPGELTLKYAVTVEVEGGKAPAVAAEWLSRVLLEDQG